ncbi:lactate utilization protein C [Kutzneria buriramensis]|uniref:L-lactate dehydrogenase complex protein LldG n=1 Tax=Kutzneria buriramensis TaxID=1045776 RepID=A0A3E0HU43_9PSEU|nr:lactate utilization protein C [Kutzneria buriramensis]REH49964.1 L-lactate dehydrogenase complex protein LldG [Kutzneria buriramensis]
MADARSVVLGRIRAALADRPAAREIPRSYDTSRPLGDLVELAAERIADYRAEVHRAAVDDVPATISRLLAERGARRMVGPVDLPASWQVDGAEWLSDSPTLSIDQLDGADGVLTGCAVAIAETGTIVLDGGVAQGRRALTLVPDYHLCVVRSDQIVGIVPEALARLEPTRPLTFISGPSATSDIELDRVEGVHGPRTLHVIIAT